MRRPRKRFPTSVYRHGTEPDARFSLANERTFLAWIRTSLALLAGGVALEALSLGMHPSLRLGASSVLILSGIATAVHAWAVWKRHERALRLNTPLPSPAMALPIMIAVATVGLLVLLGVFFR